MINCHICCIFLILLITLFKLFIADTGCYGSGYEDFQVKDFASIPCIDVDGVGCNTLGNTPDYQKGFELEAVKLSNFISSSHATSFNWSITSYVFYFNNCNFLD